MSATQVGGMERAPAGALSVSERPPLAANQAMREISNELREDRLQREGSGWAAAGREYRRLYAEYGQCPIEAGLMFSDPINECEHGNLPRDRNLDCDCWGARPEQEVTPKKRRPTPTLEEILKVKPATPVAPLAPKSASPPANAPDLSPFLERLVRELEEEAAKLTAAANAIRSSAN